mgnify:CR=1 FL=1
MKEEAVKKVVRDGYSRIAKQESSCCGPASICSGTTGLQKTVSKAIGYNDEELGAVPAGANLGLGCGNPVAFASLKEGETVLDLGSGAGFDCFLAADRVGSKGKVIGVDMTPEMIEKARENAAKGNYTNVEFRLGEIENLPVVDNSVDIVISNCVINLAPDKGKVFKEACRALTPGGRLMISDIVLLEELPDFIKNSVEAYIGCISGAIIRDEYIETVKGTGFEEVKIVDEAAFPIESMANDPTAQAIIKDLRIPAEEVKKIGSSIVSIKVCGVKPEEVV